MCVALGLRWALEIPRISYFRGTFPLRIQPNSVRSSNQIPMKKSIISLSLVVMVTISSLATVITVSNTANTPGQYTDLQTAVDASSPGDTIYIAGSPNVYGTTINIYWQLTLIGAGYNNPYGDNTEVSTMNLYRSSASIGASGCKVIGIKFQYNLYLNGYFSGGDITNQKIDNVVIERCHWSASYGVTFAASSAYSYSNDTIRNCYFLGSNTSYVGVYFAAGTFNNIIVHNNLFDNKKIGVTFANANDFSTVYIKNNVFINPTQPTYSVIGQGAASTNNGVAVENNIFRGAHVSGCTNCVFNNNITYLANNDTLVYSGNSGSTGGANIIATDPMLVNYPFTGGYVTYAHDLRLQAGSPGENAGADGSNIGMYGGLLPFEQFGMNPNIPQMESVSFPNGSAVGVGGTLNVDFKSHKQD